MPTDKNKTKPRIVAGCMTGTSLDALDVALVKIDGHGLDMKPALLGHHAQSLPADLRETLMHLATGHAAEPIVFLRAARQLGLFHAEVLGDLFDQHPDAEPDFVTAHGQTIWHAPRNRDKDSPDLGPMSWQLFDPWPVVHRHGIPVCYDLRQADLIAGGEGAPITPIADWVMYREHADHVVNLGGVMNITHLGKTLAKTQAGDVYPCNLMLDGLCKELFDQRFDLDGKHAMQGNVKPELMVEFANAVDDAVKSRSLGREQFDSKWIDHLLLKTKPLASPEDILRTGCHMVALTIHALTTGGLFSGKQRVALAGGGVRNQGIIAQWAELDGSPALLSDDLGIPCEAREAMGFAVLGALSQDGVPVSLAQVTGAKDPGVAGVWAGV